MRIAIQVNTYSTGAAKGDDYFIEEIISRMIHLHPEDEFYFLSGHSFSMQMEFASNVKVVQLKPQTGFRTFQNWLFKLRLPKQLKKIKADVYVCTDAAYSFNTSMNQCLILRNSAFEKYYKIQSKSNRKILLKSFSKVKTVITTTEYFKKEISNYFLIPAEQIEVVCQAAHSIFQPIQEEVKEKLKLQYTEGNEYFIYPGLIEPGNNFINLLKAFSVFKNKQKTNMKLILTGKMKGNEKEIIQKLNLYKYRDEVKIIANTQRSLKAKLLAGAYAFIDLSEEETVCLPALEALQCKVPVIISNTISNSEIGKEAYLYVNPNLSDDLAEKMILLYKDETLRSKLIENGGKRTAIYSWDAATKKMWDCIVKTTVS